MSDPLDDMYREVILDHYRSPRGKKPIKKKDIESEGKNPLCGDEIEMELDMDNNKVKDVHVNCHGCAISVASGSMLAEYIKGKSLDEVKKIGDVVKKMLKGEVDNIPDDLSDLDALKGVRNYPVRIKCALLAWMTLIEGVKNYEKGKNHQKASISTEDKEKQ